MRGWEKIFHANGHDRKARVTMPMSDKIDFFFNKERQRRTLFNGQGIHSREDITIINIYAPKIGEPR